MSELTEKLRQEAAAQEKIRSVLRGRNVATDALEKMLTYYPETGPLRRELYSKHMAFFEAGATHHSRLCVSGNRCITPWTPIETRHATRRCVELLGETEFDVRSWDGGSRCTKRASSVFLKGIEPAFRVHLDNGQFFDVTGKHRVLSDAGWIAVSQLVRLSDGLHCWHTGIGLKANYALDGRRYGGQPPFLSGSGQVKPPSPSSALRHGHSFVPLGVEEPKFGRSRVFPACVPFSILDDPSQIADLCEQFQDPEERIDAEWRSWTRRELRRFVLALAQTQGDHEAFLSCMSEGPEVEEIQDRDVCNSPASSTELLQSLWLCGAFDDPDREESGSLQGDLRALTYGCFFPFRMPSLAGRGTIQCIIPLGLQPILDFEVSETHCYESGGVIHHNTGKSEGILCYEATLHLTGKYPPWWKGRRFNRPITAWLAGKTSETTRDILQAKLLGRLQRDPEHKGDAIGLGTGMVPKALIISTTPKSGVPDGIDTVWVRHATGGASQLGFKCHPAGSMLLMADGAWMPIEIVRLGDKILSPDGTAREVTQTYAYANAPLLEVNTRSGSIKATPNHPFFTENRGWVDAGDLVTGDVLSVCSSEKTGEIPREEWLVCMTALIIGDGCTRSYTPQFTCNEPAIVEAVENILPPDLYVRKIARRISYKIASSIRQENRLTASLRADGIWGLKSTSKFIPRWVFRLPLAQRELFLRWLFGCDGTISKKHAMYATSSRRLARDVRLLLWSVGIHADIKDRPVRCNGKAFLSWSITLHGDNRLRFQSIGKLNRTVECNVKPRPKGPLGEIVSISPCSPANVYCVGVEDVHELIVDGYRVGNTYGKDRDSFEGTEKDLIGLDEEPPSDVDDECSMRLMSTKPGEEGGIKIITFTPLEGYTEVVKKYLESNDEGRFFIQIGWDDAPHISQAEKDRMSKQYLPAQLRARSKGEPSMGEGAIYPMPVEELLVDDFKLPDHFPRAFGLDVGKTAAIWGALDRDNDILYLYREYFSEEYNTLLHSIAIKGVKGENSWIPGVIDPAALGSSQVDGQKLMNIYTNLGIKLQKADNAVWAGIDSVWSRMSTGRLRVFRSLRRWQNEYGRYHTKRRETAIGITSQVVKKDDHLMDATRYLVHSGIGRMKCRPSIQEVARKTFGSVSGDSRTGGWMH